MTMKKNAAAARRAPARAMGRSTAGERPETANKGPVPSRNAPPAVGAPQIQPVKLTAMVIESIALTECAMRSLSNSEIGPNEQIVLKRALAELWRVHDALGELSDDDAHDEDENE